MPSVDRRPFTGSGGRYNPGPTTTPPLLAMSRPLDDALAPPWALRRTSPVFSGEADSRRSLRPTPLPTVSPADRNSELGPRSLDPDRPFWSAYAELIRDQRSPADFCNEHDVRANQPGLWILAGTEASTSFLFSTWHALSLAEAVTRGEPRYVRLLDPSVGSSHLRGFAQP
jgi:hypothetical protein